ncbi:hypothetical protein BU24DRAFT_243892 [Aaosphaeria arxii CBS 175.79]|uniref:Uncharacterized protein n=1 Tax=Aaosphaeria arxii CBS 175.79 TaxID=1450172 RepID=A0A6A5XLT0_9PLEO|nr:uncharacterized protein BU24DRAFT_243892 [Aaosphaeria arxii CBS 175.79]KAF2013690.1 hypothetical protein BU24DRAFT_243892 [Aaosphaeria arxii CBS 175.79]
MSGKESMALRRVRGVKEEVGGTRSGLCFSVGGGGVVVGLVLENNRENRFSECQSSVPVLCRYFSCYHHPLLLLSSPPPQTQQQTAAPPPHFPSIKRESTPIQTKHLNPNRPPIPFTFIL